MIGSRALRVEDMRFLRGEGRYVADRQFPFAAEAMIVRSPHAHARIIKIEVKSALRSGALAVFTAEDLPAAVRPIPSTEAMYLMARHVFEDLGYRRYEWKCNAFNLPSRRAAVRLGFSFEGIFKQHMIQKGRSRDTAWYSMLDCEWPRYKLAYEKWLSPDNFDAFGSAKVRLATLLKPARP